MKELGCSTVAVRITTLFYDGQQLSEDRALGFHRPPDFTKALAEGSHLDVVSNPEVYACLQAISQEMQFASDNMVCSDWQIRSKTTLLLTALPFLWGCCALVRRFSPPSSVSRALAALLAAQDA